MESAATAATPPPPYGKLCNLHNVVRTVAALESFYAGKMRVDVETINDEQYATAMREQRDTSVIVAGGMNVYALGDETAATLQERFPNATPLFINEMLRRPYFGDDAASMILFDLPFDSPLELMTKSRAFTTTEDRERWHFNAQSFNRIKALFLCTQERPVPLCGIAALLPSHDIESLYVIAFDALGESAEKLLSRTDVPFASDHIVPLVPHMQDAPNVVFGQVRVVTAPADSGVSIALTRLFIRTSVLWLFSEKPYRKYDAV
jgi:hypothetical protein